jgi:hypothetical protein
MAHYSTGHDAGEKPGFRMLHFELGGRNPEGHADLPDARRFSGSQREMFVPFAHSPLINLHPVVSGKSA